MGVYIIDGELFAQTGGSDNTSEIFISDALVIYEQSTTLVWLIGWVLTESPEVIMKSFINTGKDVRKPIFAYPFTQLTLI